MDAASEPTRMTFRLTWFCVKYLKEKCNGNRH